MSKHLLSLVLGTTSALFAGSAVAQVDLAAYGFEKSVIEAAECVSKRIPSHLATAVVYAYWTPLTQLQAECGHLYEQTSSADLLRAKVAFLDSLSTCTGYKYRSDEGLWVSEVADATAVISAAGVRDALSGQSLLNKLNLGAHACKHQ